MKAIRVHQFGEPEVMQLETVADLKPAPNEIVVEVKAVGVNPVDAYIRSGAYTLKPSLPYTPGFDCAGAVKEVGKKVKKFSRGNRVYVAGSLSGAYAQETLCLESQVHFLPKHISFEEGAGIGVPYVTAHRALFGKAKAKSKETVLIHGASGGVGLAAVQFAKLAKLKVIGTAGSERGCQLVKDNGADYVLNHHGQNYLDEILKITKAKGVDIILEMLANENLGKDLTIAAKNGRIVVIGSRGTVEINPRDTMRRELTIMGMTMMNRLPEELKEIHHAIQLGLKRKKLKPFIGKTFPLTEAPLAHKSVMAPRAYGKIVLIP